MEYTTFSQCDPPPCFPGHAHPLHALVGSYGGLRGGPETHRPLGLLFIFGDLGGRGHPRSFWVRPKARRSSKGLPDRKFIVFWVPLRPAGTYSLKSPQVPSNSLKFPVPRVVGACRPGPPPLPRAFKTSLRPLSRRLPQ